MIKIKDNVDLKILENYGFKFKPYKNKDVIYGKTIVAFDDHPKYLKCDIYVYGFNREISADITYGKKFNAFESVDGNELCFSTLYDLIQDGLVEKVEE